MRVVNSVAGYPHSIFRRSQIIIFAKLFHIYSLRGLLFEEVLVRSQSCLEFVDRLFFWFAKIVPILMKPQNHIAMNIKCLPLNVL